MVGMEFSIITVLLPRLSILGQEGRVFSRVMMPQLLIKSWLPCLMSDLEKALRVDSFSLSPTQGCLKGWLNHNTKLHMPLPPLLYKSF